MYMILLKIKMSIKMKSETEFYIEFLDEYTEENDIMIIKNEDAKKKCQNSLMRKRAKRECNGVKGKWNKYVQNCFTTKIITESYYIQSITNPRVLKDIISSKLVKCNCDMCNKDLCSRGFCFFKYSDVRLETHIKRKHGNGPLTFECFPCGRTFKYI